MKPAPAPNSKPSLLIPSSRDECILREIAQYRFLTALDCSHLGLFSPKSLTFVRERLTLLAGGEDYKDRSYLYRFPFPSTQGNRERIYTLGSAGRDILENLGLEISWHFKPAKMRTYSHSFLLHDLTRNRFVVALLAWVRTKRNLTVESHLSYELAKAPAIVEIPIQGKMFKVSVILDGLIIIDDTNSGKSRVLLLEIDQNTQAESRFRQHIAARLAYTTSSAFTKVYGNIPYRIAYATHGLTPSAAQARLKSMCAWAMDVLTHLKKQEYARYFRFTTLNFATLYEDASALFEAPLWHRPDDPTTPVPLLTG